MEDLRAMPGAAGRAIFSVACWFNLANILLVVAIEEAGMAVAFPVGIGLALVIGTVQSYVLSPQGNAALLMSGVGLILSGAMIMSALAHTWLGQTTKNQALARTGFFDRGRVPDGLLLPAAQRVRDHRQDFTTHPIRPGLLTPYTALVLFSIGLLASNFVFNTIFYARGPGFAYADLFRFHGRARLHWLGFLGGCIWSRWRSAWIRDRLRGEAGPAIAYALGQGATLVAAIWGVFIWREFAGAPQGTWKFLISTHVRGLCRGPGVDRGRELLKILCRHPLSSSAA